jgi:hypothetical protein
LTENDQIFKTAGICLLLAPKLYLNWNDAQSTNSDGCFSAGLADSFVVFVVLPRDYHGVGVNSE